MRTNYIVIASLIFLTVSLSACSSTSNTAIPSASSVIEPTSKPTQTASPSPAPSATPKPTATSLPPTATFEPAPPLNRAILESTLREHGYKRTPMGEDGFYWSNGSGIDFYTIPEGMEITFLNDPANQAGRHKLIDKSISISKPLFSSSFNEEMRQVLHGYADEVQTRSGEPEILDYGQEPWLGRLMAFNVQHTMIQNGAVALPVIMSLNYREYRCDMSKYDYCYFYDMPTITFTGEASLTFFSIMIPFPETLSRTNDI